MIILSWRSILKKKMVKGKIYHTFDELEQVIVEYIHYYNHDRIKEKLTDINLVEYRHHTIQFAV
ncbi:IS3 family transposase [Viridibacillus sp. NPDC093762]|uniref:IS3 family transposase n=1 Tax=Viridibacillus sp. NPDC093762 TaxID=3390720 RepID=UPI003CFECA6F